MSSTPHHKNGTPAAAYLISGEDAGLVSQELSSLLDELTGLTALAGVIVEEYSPATRDDPVPIGAVLDACRTPPFLSEKRLVVVRDGSVLDQSQLKEIVAYLNEPLSSTVFILVVAGKAATPTLRKAFGGVGYVIDAQPGSNARALSQWFVDHLANAPVRFEGQALSLLQSHLGQDVARLEGIVGALEAAYGPGATIRTDELQPFLGSEGSVAPWDLTDAIDTGNIPEALATLRRMMVAGERHPLQILATLHRHFGAMLRLDGEESISDADAAVATGMSAFPAGKALRQSRQLRHENIARAITLLANADLDLRGRVAWPAELVMEVLIARLAQLARVRGHSRQGSVAPHRTTQRNVR